MDPISLGTIAGSYFSNLGNLGQIASVGSSLIGGIGKAFGLGGGKKRGPDLDDQYVAAHRWRGAEFDQKMELADKYGISKLYMLGAQPSQLPSVSIMDQSGPSASDRLSDFGQDLSRASRSTMTHNDRLQDTLSALSLERAGLENELLRSQITRVRQQSNPGLPNNNSNGLSATIGDIPANHLGIDDSIQPLFKIGYDQKGNPVRVFNEEGLGDNDWAQLATLPVTAMDLWHGNVTRPAASRLANGVRRARNWMFKPLYRK